MRPRPTLQSIARLYGVTVAQVSYREIPGTRAGVYAGPNWVGRDLDEAERRGLRALHEHLFNLGEFAACGMQDLEEAFDEAVNYYAARVAVSWTEAMAHVSGSFEQGVDYADRPEAERVL